MDGIEDHVLRIDCESCAMSGTSACDDCVVTFLCGPEPQRERHVVLSLDELRALRTLSAGGLAPRLRHRRRA